MEPRVSDMGFVCNSVQPGEAFRKKVVPEISNLPSFALFGPSWPKKALSVVWRVYITSNTIRKVYLAGSLMGQLTPYD